MGVIDEWLNPVYLDETNVENIRQSINAKPIVKYAVLDNFFNADKLDSLINSYADLNFSEELDRRSHDGKWLPYDGEVVFADSDCLGSELFFDEEWHRYCCYLTDTNLQFPVDTDIKLRRHRHDADGFWIHTDSAIRSLVIISYFNKNWRADDGGLLQLWRVDETLSDGSLRVDSPSGRLDVLNNERIQTKSPGGGFADKKPHDLVLIDQIVPVYNRVFICNLRANPTYHSVTPSNGKQRLGFVQWLFNRK